MADLILKRQSIEDLEKLPTHGFRKSLLLSGYKKAVDKNRSCKHCIYLHRKRYNGKYYFKCELIGDTDSEATDIRLSYVCNRFSLEVF